MSKSESPIPAPIREQYSEDDAAYRYFVVTPVNNGVAYLDMYYSGWYKRVDLKLFDMRYPDMNILAHVHGVMWSETPEGKDWSFPALTAHGFYHSDNGVHDYDTLTLRWRTIIMNRKAGL